MAFTDLAEHLEEVFSERGAEAGELPARTGLTDRERRSSVGYAAKNARKCAKRAAAQEAKRRAELLDGTRPARCDGPDCCNLLNPKPRNGIRFLFCGTDCTSARGYRRRNVRAGVPEARRRYTRR